MPRQSILLLSALLLPACLMTAQVTSTGQNFTVQVSTVQPWTDSGLDLQSGDVLEISATASPDQQVVSGAPACDPKGVTAAAATTSARPPLKPQTCPCPPRPPAP